MTKHNDIERRLYEFSLGELRLLDTILDKAGQRKLADWVRDLLVDWRAYPSRTNYSPQALRKYVVTLGKIVTALRKTGQSAASDHAAQVRREIASWIRKA